MIDALLYLLSSSLGISSIPLFLIFLDHNNKNNVHKAVIYIIVFVLCCFFLLPLLSRSGMIIWLALFTPFILFFYVVFCKYLFKKEIRDTDENKELDSDLLS